MGFQCSGGDQADEVRGFASAERAILLEETVAEAGKVSGGMLSIAL
jgi:hypothetical protein